MGRTNLLKVDEGVFIARGQIKPLGEKDKENGQIKTARKVAQPVARPADRIWR